MDLLERYLQAVGKYLPDATKSDTLAELRANLLEQMDARAEELGRDLNNGDVAAILLEHGKPEQVALRYLPQRSLIGPTIFPFYLFTLRKLLPVVTLAYVVGQSAVLLMSGPANLQAWRVLEIAWKLVPVLLVFAAVVTFAFAMVEYWMSRGGLRDTLTRWDPMRLPAVHPETSEVKQKSMAQRVVELCLHILWMLYVLAIPYHPFWILGPGVYFLAALSVGFAPVWHTFFLLLIALLVVQLAIKLFALRPGVHPWEKPMELLTNLVGTALIATLAFANVLFVPAGPATNLERLANINFWMSRSFKLLLVLALFGFVQEAWKVLRPARLAGQLAF